MDVPAKKPRGVKKTVVKVEPVSGSPTPTPKPARKPKALQEPAPLKEEVKEEVADKPKRTRKAPVSTPTSSSLSPTSTPTDESTVVAPGCQAIIGSGALAGQCCNCKVKPPSTDRCGRHLKAKAESTSKSPASATKPARAKRTSTAKAAQSKEAQLRASVARLNAQFITHIEVNEFNQAVYPGTKILLDQTRNCALGVLQADRTVRPLNVDEIAFCRRVFVPVPALPVVLSDGDQKEEKEAVSTAPLKVDPEEQGLEDDEEDEEDEEEDGEEENETDELEEKE